MSRLKKQNWWDKFFAFAEGARTFGHMSKIIATCGHEVTWEWFDSGKGNIIIKDKDREGKDCISSLVVCPECRKWYEGEGLIVKSPRKTTKTLCEGDMGTPAGVPGRAV